MRNRDSAQITITCDGCGRSTEAELVQGAEENTYLAPATSEEMPDGWTTDGDEEDFCPDCQGK